MKKLFAVAFLVSMLCDITIRAADYPASAHEGIEWCDIWISHGTETNLPRVLLIGDSITRAYYPEVEKRLEGKAYVARLASSAFISDPVLVKQIEMVEGQYHFDVIHFNNGMHGWNYGEQEYEAAFPAFLKAIKKGAPKAKLIWGATTSVRNNDARNKRIVERNAMARKFVEARGIAVDDLYTPTLNHPEYHEDDVHFNHDGIVIQATQVAAAIEPLLPK